MKDNEAIVGSKAKQQVVKLETYFWWIYLFPLLDGCCENE